MLHLQKKSIALSLAVLATLFSACGSDDTTTSTAATTTTINGQLVDGYITGAHYTCADGKEALTQENGTFSCDKLPISFRLGSIKLGEVAQLPEDNHIFPQDLVGVTRDDINNSEVLAMAQLLQSLDSDNNPDNGIEIETATVEKITLSEDFDAQNLDTYLSNADVSKVSQEDAHKHLEKTTHTVETIEKLDLPKNIEDILNTPLSTLSDDVKNHIAYMGNEERLAYDVYNALFTLFPALKTLENIPQKSEIKHIAAVKGLVAKYNLESELLSIRDINNTTLSADSDVESVAGVYDIEKIQNLYNTLISIGETSQTAALQVGCMVEVTDIDDLDIAIVDATDANATDVVATFEFLRDGSYSHYWAFDNSLKTAGVTDGCCSAGDLYCKTEAQYPNLEKGSDEGHQEQQKGKGEGDGSGEQKHKGRE